MLQLERMLELLHGLTLQQAQAQGRELDRPGHFALVVCYTFCLGLLSFSEVHVD
jgi:hypothetical protein